MCKLYFGKFIGLGSMGFDRMGMIVVMVDGFIWYVLMDIDLEVFCVMCMIYGVEEVDMELFKIGDL